MIEGLESNPHPKFNAVDQHTKFFYTTLVTLADMHEKIDMSDVGLPKAKDVTLDYKIIDCIPGNLPQNFCNLISYFLYLNFTLTFFC